MPFGFWLMAQGPWQEGPGQGLGLGVRLLTATPPYPLPAQTGVAPMKYTSSIKHEGAWSIGGWVSPTGKSSRLCVRERGLVAY